MHRYTPLLAHQQGWRVTEIPVQHRARRHGRSKFGFERYARAGLDLVTVLFLGHYEHRPLHLFGGLGAAMMLAGFVMAVYLTILKLGGEAIGGRPLLSLSVLLIVVGVQFLSLGLVAQMLVVIKESLERRLGQGAKERFEEGGEHPARAHPTAGRGGDY